MGERGDAPGASSPAVGQGEVDSHADTAVGSRGAAEAREARASTADALDALVGTVLEQRYEILRKIGQGGMGAVYEATHKLIGKRVAVKVLLDKYVLKDQVVARLEQEARLASSIGHANIIDITDFGQTADGRTFVVMEFLEGESLGALISRSGRLDPQRAIGIAHQVASALAAAHQKGIVHRDIKPENIFLIQRGEEDFVKVVDFGISKSMRPDSEEDSPRLTQTGMVLGTPLYMSPEQARGDDELDHRIDIYALGVILYEMVTAEVPFRGSNYLNILSQVLSDEATPPSQLNPEVSADLEAVIFKAMEKDRAERYQTLDEMAADLASLQGDALATTGARLTANRRRRRAVRRSAFRGMLWVAGIAVIAAAAVVTARAVIGGGGEEAKAVQPGVVGAADAGAGSSAAAAAPATGDAGPKQAPVSVARIKIESTPSGVEVFEGDRRLGVTPFERSWEKVNRAIVLTGEKAGYDYATIQINPYFDDGQRVMLRLKKARSGVGKRPERRGPPGDTPSSSRDDTAGGDLTGTPYRKGGDP